MRKIYKVISCMLVAGALIAGIGSGVAFAEYSNFEYGGEKVLEGSEYITKVLNYQVSNQGDTQDKQKLYIETMYGHTYSTIVEDTSVPKNSVRFEIEYLTDQKDIRPEIEEVKLSNDDLTKQYIRLNCAYSYNDVRDFMRIKNVLLEDIKTHTLSDYRMDGIQCIRILVNPDADFMITLNADDFYSSSYMQSDDYEEAVTEETTSEVLMDENNEDVKESAGESATTTEVLDSEDILEE